MNSLRWCQIILLAAASMAPASSAQGQTEARAFTVEERSIISKIRQEFQKNSALITALYQRALKDDPSLTGYIRLEINISPMGDVIECTIASSDLKSELVNDLLPEIVMDMKFKGLGNKDPLVVTYPIEFLPQ